MKNFLHYNSNVMEISIWSYPYCNELILTSICTWHSSSAGVACVKICNDVLVSNGEVQWNEVFTEFELWGKWVSEMGPWSMLTMLGCQTITNLTINRYGLIPYIMQIFQIFLNLKNMVLEICFSFQRVDARILNFFLLKILQRCCKRYRAFW